MQFRALIIAAVAAVAAAAPSDASHHGCEPATYSCLPHGKPGWRVCDVSRNWVFAGNCPPKTKCYFNEENNSPYCI